MNDNLIYDIGMHDGSDTEYYLWKGYNVVAVDANPHLIEKAADKFGKHIKKGKLILVNVAISNNEGPITFYLSKNDIWSSLDPNISNREGLLSQQVQVDQKRITSLFAEFGVPFYCKIDIEGYDVECLRSMVGASEVPPYISAETEAVSEAGSDEENALITVNMLYALGYRQFKLIDQSSLTALTPEKTFYHKSTFKRGLNAVHRKLNLSTPQNYRKMISDKIGYRFPYGSSGPFGENLLGRWYNYHEAKGLILKHRADYYQRSDAKTYGFWCDWHAKL